MRAFGAALLGTLADMHNWRAVAACATEALQNLQDSADLYLYRGTALVEQRQLDPAISDLKRSRELNERNPAVHYHLSRAYAETGQFSLALQSANRALQIRPDDTRFALMKARLHHQLGEYDTELYYLNALLDTRPDNFEYVRLKALNQIARKEVSAACATIEKFLERSSSHAAALIFCAELNEKLGRDERAEICYRKLHKAPRVSSYAFRAFAGFLLRREDAAGAIEILTRGSQQHPGDISIEIALATAMQALGQNQECVERLTEVLAGNPGTPELQWVLGRSLFALGEHERALECFQQARALETRCNGNSAPTFRWLLAEAYALHELGRTSEAIKLLEGNFSQFEKFENEYAEALGELYERAGHYAKAQIIYSQTLRTAQATPELHYRMARAALADGKKTVLLRHLRAAIEMEPSVVEAVGAEPVFRKHWLSISINRLVGFRLFLGPMRNRLISLVYHLKPAMRLLGKK